jgi:hypothetical protein
MKEIDTLPGVGVVVVVTAKYKYFYLKRIFSHIDNVYE